jgi:hypothetical protein
MCRVAHTVWIAVSALALGGCVTSETKPNVNAPTVKSAGAQPYDCGIPQSQEAPRTPMTAEEFRCVFPLGAEADAILADYDKVQAALVSAAATGAEASVAMLSAGGDVHGGYDVFYTAEPLRNKEVRDNYTAVQVGSRGCFQTKGDKTDCREVGPLRLGLFRIPKDHVARVWSRDFRCVHPDEPCRFIKVQLASLDTDTNAIEGYTADPEITGHEYEVAFRLADYLPIYVRQTDRYHVAITAIAYYAFHFGGTVEPVELPRDGESLDGASH